MQEPRLIGAVSDKTLLKTYDKYGIDFTRQHSIATIVGASGLLIGLGKVRGIEGLCLMGETFDLPRGQKSGLVEARRILAEMFQLFMADPGTLPPEWSGKAGTADEAAASL